MPHNTQSFILTAKRLFLRPFVPEDIHWLSRLLQHPEVMRFSPKGPLSHEEAQAYMQSNIDSFCLRKFGRLACCLIGDTSEGLPIGFCGIEALELDERIYLELGYRFFPEVWGKGYATEAACAVRDYAFDDLNLGELFSFIDSQNVRSIRVATKIGATLAFSSVYRGIALGVYRHSKSACTR